MTHILEQAQWLWGQDVGHDNTWCGFSRSVQWQTGQTASISLFAAMRYRLYVNGRCINSGPAPFRFPVIMADSYDISPYLSDGENTIFILVNSIGRNVKWANKEDPGLLAAIEINGDHILSDDSWDCYHLQAWHAETPWITWARERVESINLSHPDAAVLHTFASEDYAAATEALHDDIKTWPMQTRAVNGLEIRDRMVPNLRWNNIHARGLPKIYRANTEVYNHQDFCGRTMLEYLQDALDVDLINVFSDKGCTLTRKQGAHGWSLAYDLGAIYCGDLSICIECDSPCTVDIGFTERWMNGRPEFSRSGSHYYMRMQCGSGRQKYRLFAPAGLRYIYIACKDIVGQIHIETPVMHASHTDLAFNDAFNCSDSMLERIYEIGRRAVITNSQACGYDCVTRELGTYLGDNLWVADMVAHITGDASHLKHLLTACADEYAAVGEINASLFGLGAPLFDYCLCPAEMGRRLLALDTDTRLIQQTLTLCEQINDDFNSCRADDGWLNVALLQERSQRIQHSELRSGLLFLDHPGLGWHARVTTGIGREDPAVGLQLFYLQALIACDEMRRYLGQETRYQDELSHQRKILYDDFYNKDACLMQDGTDPNAFSQLINALAVITGVLQGDEAHTAMRIVSDIDRSQHVAQSSPYGYFYIIDALQTCGLRDRALRMIRSAWTPMIERGATCTWESFNGEIHDSYNHAWSAILPYAAYRILLDLQPQTHGYEEIIIDPAINIIDQCSIKLPLPVGELEVSWQRQSHDSCLLTINSPRTIHVSGQKLTAGQHELRMALSTN